MLRLVAPMIPHVAEEGWHARGHDGLIALARLARRSIPRCWSTTR